MSSEINVLVVGAGAVGAYFGGRLSQAPGVSVATVCRSNYESIREHGFEIESIAGDFVFRPDGVFRTVAEYPRQADYVLVATKALPEIDVVTAIRPAICPKTAIVLIQNGIDVEHEIAAAFPDNELISGIAYIGVVRQGDNKICHQGSGRLKFGLYPEGVSERLQILTSKFNIAEVECEAVDDIVLFRWIKLIWNVPYNPVSVLAGGADTKTMSEPPLEELCADIMREVCAVAAADGKKLPDDIVEKNLEYTRNFPPYKTSMLMDFENRRPLEVEAIIGNVVKIARKNHVKAPRLDTIHALLHAVNRQNCSDLV